MTSTEHLRTTPTEKAAALGAEHGKAAGEAWRATTADQHAYRTFGKGEGVQACLVCGVEARCIHDRNPLRWVDDSWYCPKCGDEWPDCDTFGRCEPHALPTPDLTDYTRAGGTDHSQPVLAAYSAAFTAAVEATIREAVRS